MVMNRRKGALTIEASIILPFVIVTISFILYFMKVFYIQSEIDGAMTRMAHDMSVYAYAFDKTGLVEAQQEVYIDAYESRAYKSSVESLLKSIDLQSFKQAQFRLDSILGTEEEAIAPSDGLGWKPLELAIQMDNIHNQIFNVVSEINRHYEEALTHSKGLALSEMMDFSNGWVAAQISEAMFKNYLDDERLRSWGVYSEKGVIDFSASTMMLYDDTINIVARYHIDMPFGHFIEDGLPIYQSVKVRAFTGSYDANTSIKKMKAPQEPLYFIATASSDNYSYHVYSCLVKDLFEGRYSEHVVDDGKLCIYCKTNYSIPVSQVEKALYPVYYTSKTSKIHLSRNCPRIRAIEIEAVTKEEAEAKGYLPCKKYGCVEKMEDH
ncbi:conserved protein of unknown function [Petrocella atlantisensis]|uniref:Pilus assembly protein n=2 Tax=Petrocella atlantisensis TaxID=2173034 RepID=A0A3P7PYT9_9FIRM|nr:MAG: hypothetical protein CVV00_08840 [Firmicutes bacterium HGW-Firmicutes-5]VDN48757.1 conserved protein of unknown function [Petrocella atlantisensis]